MQHLRQGQCVALCHYQLLYYATVQLCLCRNVCMPADCLTTKVISLDYRAQFVTTVVWCSRD